MNNIPPDSPDPPALTLQPEIAAAREVLDGLMALWRGQPELTADDARRLSVLVFNGARAVAILLTHQSRLNAHTPDMDWLDASLYEMSRELGVEL